MGIPLKKVRGFLRQHDNKAVFTQLPPSETYSSSSKRFSIATVSAGKSGVSVTKKSGWHTCREELCSSFFSLFKDVSSDPTYLLLRGFDEDNLRYGMRVINYFEEKMGWGQSFVVDTNHSGTLLLVGSTYWMTSGPHLSLLTLFLRLLSVYRLNEGESSAAYLKRLYDMNSTGDLGHWRNLYSVHQDIMFMVMKHRISLRDTLDYDQISRKGEGYYGINNVVARANQVATGQLDQNNPDWFMHDFTERLAALIKQYQGKRVTRKKAAKKKAA